MSKMGLHDPFGHLQHKLWQKERPGVKTNILTPDHKKLRIDPTSVHASGVRYGFRVQGLGLKALDESCNFALDLIPIGGLSTKLQSHKVAGVLTLAILGFLEGSPGTKKAMWMWALQRGAQYTIWGKVVASPKSGPW